MRDVTEVRFENGLSVEGQVLNGTSRPADGVSVSIAIYDENGLFTGDIWTVIDVTIPPDKSAQFEINTDNMGVPQDPIGVAGPNFTHQLWVGFGSSFGVC